MNRSTAKALLGPLLLASVCALPATPAVASSEGTPSACKPSPMVLTAVATRVPGLSAQQSRNATAIINAAEQLHIPSHGQTLAVMTALEESSLQSTGAHSNRSTGHSDHSSKKHGRISSAAGSALPSSSALSGADPSGGLFGVGSSSLSKADRANPTASAENFYKSLSEVQNWENMPPTLAAHAAQHNLDPDVYSSYWPKAVKIVNALTSGVGTAGMANLAARAQKAADCEAAMVHGKFTLAASMPYVGPFTPEQLIARARDFAINGGSVWHDRCQSFVAQLAGRPTSGYATALDAWQTFQAQGVAHPATGPDGTSPPVGAWLYYASGNPAGHVDTYLGNGQIASTDVFGDGRVGIGPASAVTNGPWRLQYLGWAAPWGQQ